MMGHFATSAFTIIDAADDEIPLMLYRPARAAPLMPYTSPPEQNSRFLDRGMLIEHATPFSPPARKPLAAGCQLMLGARQEPAADDAIWLHMNGACLCLMRVVSIAASSVDMASVILLA